jgi:hypothetical protein
MDTKDIVLSAFYGCSPEVRRTEKGPCAITEVITLVMYDKDYRAMYNQALRIPSDKNPANQFSVQSDYSMHKLMTQEEFKILPLIAEEMSIQDGFHCRGVRKNLKNSDLYFLYQIYTERPYRNQGYCKIFLEHVFEHLQMIAREPHPVIVTSPYVYGNEWHDDMDPALAESITKMLLDAGFKPVRKNSSWYYLTK